MMREVNVALIGYAFMGRAHSNAYRQVTRFFSPRWRPRMKVICGRDRARVEAARRTLGWDEAATDWEAVVGRTDIDLVDICVPGHLHAPIAIAAARAGKAVLCEKPLANTLREAEQMLAAVRKAGVAHMVCHNYRRAPAVMLARQIIDDGVLGEVRHFRGSYLQDWLVDPASPISWRLDRRTAGSGALGDLASHAVDLARFLVGEIAEVTGDLKTFTRSRPRPGRPRARARVSVDDAASALIRFANGAMGTIDVTRMAPGRKNANRFEINGSAGSVAFDVEQMNELEVYSTADAPTLRGFRRVLVTDETHPYIKAWWPPGHLIGYEHTFTHTVFDLLEAMADHRLPTPNFTDGVRAQRVLHAIETSARTRRWTKVG
jgi:predicted dehydrogenase